MRYRFSIHISDESVYLELKANQTTVACELGIFGVLCQKEGEIRTKLPLFPPGGPWET